MNKTYLLAIAAALVAAPMALAHTDGGVYGTPKSYCETTDTNVHDYAVNGATGVAYLLWQFQDGNVADCDLDGVPGDFDGHSEWSTGGAYLLASDPAATTCFGEAAHHPSSPSVWVFDHAWPSGVLFVVGADTSSFPQPDPNDPTVMIDCGDGIDDVDTGYCLDHCTVGFPPGTDGAYHVFVVNEVFTDDPIVDGPIIDATQTSDQTDLNAGIICVNDPTDTAYWICVYLFRNVTPPGVDPRFAAAGHVYT